MRTSDFYYDLPEQAIAKFPILPHEQARLLHLQPQTNDTVLLNDYHIADLPNLLNPHDLLIVNNTKVLPALLHATRQKRDAYQKQNDGNPDNNQGVFIKCNLLEPANQNYHAMDALWVGLAYPSKKITIGDKMHITKDFYWQLEEKLSDGRILLRFNCEGDDLLQQLHQHGAMPIPPYLKRESEHQDKTHYQTCFAKHQGAVAAPTAGLHFTSELLQKLQRKNISIAEITLHVGAGTFLPVKTKNIQDHVIHHEWGELSQTAIDAIKTCKANHGDIIAVGTTSLRLLEWAMIKTKQQKPDNLYPDAQTGMVDIFITPGFPFKLCDRLMTNFHQPCSTLMALVSAFSGRENILTGYQHAIHNQYRFLSYGDACLLNKDVS